jgi:hypothetical protein
MASHQTIHLSRGAHRSPDHGVCVMELASILAGEEFTDRPQSVSPVIRNFLRAYNDGLDDRPRQTLYPLAARVVGTQASRAVERSRARLCVEWLEKHGRRAPWVARLGLGAWAAAGTAAASCALRDRSARGHRRALALVDELIALGDGWAGIPANPAELLARGRAPRETV